MSYKPADFFVGVMDFFSVLLPGALLAFLGSEFATRYVFVPPLPQLPTAAARWVAFAFAAYLLGQFTFLVSATFMDTLYDRTYRDYRRRKGDAGYARAKAIEGEADSSIAGVLKWANVFVRTHNPAMGDQLDQLEATSKFFRSVTIVLAVFAIVLLASGKIAAALVCLLLVGLSFWRFANQRWKFTELTYLAFIQMNTTSTPRSAPAAAAASR